ncbi:MAG: outer membrane beta-barrel protein [Pseudomonadota bacterium]
MTLVCIPPVRILSPILLMFLLSVSHVAQASEKWFAAVKASIGDVEIDGISHGGTIGTGALINGEIDGQLEDTAIDDYTAGLGFSLGRRIRNWHYEAEYIYRYRTDWDLVAPTPSIQTITNVFSDIETHTLMLNVARRGVISQNWSWELGAGIGLASNDIDGEYIERQVPGIRPEMVFKDDDGGIEFVYNLFAGVTRDLRGPWTFNIRYRYIDLGEVEIGPFPGRASQASGDYTSGELQFSLERNF